MNILLKEFINVENFLNSLKKCKILYIYYIHKITVYKCLVTNLFIQTMAYLASY